MRDERDDHFGPIGRCRPAGLLRLDTSETIKGAQHDLGEQPFPLIGFELQGASDHRPAGGEEKDRRGEREKQKSALLTATWSVAMTEGGGELFQGRSEWGGQRLHGHRTAVGQIAE